MHVNGSLVARLLYLLHKNDTIDIPQPLLRYIPGSNFIMALINEGIGASEVDPSMVQQLLEIGGQDNYPGPGNAKEAVTIIQRLVDDSLKVDTRLNLEKRLGIYRILDSLSSTMSEHGEIVDLTDPGEIIDIPKFQTGFQPLDAVVGGSIYQGIFVLMGPPGSGKTSLMISIMETARKTGWDGSIMFLENEIPPMMMKGRLSPVFKRTQFRPGDELICHTWNAKNLLSYLQDHPDPNRLVLFDSPDVMLGPSSSMNSFGKKAFQDEQYRLLVELKRSCRAIIVSSWPNREKERVEHINQISDAIEKVRYADAVVGINPLANNRLQLLGLKNRFGPNGVDLAFDFNMATLDWSEASVELESEFWNSFQADAEAEQALAEQSVTSGGS